MYGITQILEWMICTNLFPGLSNGGGLILGTAMYFPVSQAGLGGLSLRFETGAVIFWSVLLLTLGVASSLVAARRVLRIDPIEATTGAGVGI